MLHGDISNRVGFTLGFQCVDFFLKFRDSKASDKLLNLIFSKVNRARVDPRVSSFMEYIYLNTDMVVDLVVEEQHNTKKLGEFLLDYPFNRLVVVKSPSQITQRLLTGDLTYFVDEDPYRLSLINNSHAITLEQLHNLLGKR